MTDKQTEEMTHQLNLRAKLLAYFLRRSLLSLQSETALGLLSQISDDLANPERLTSPERYLVQEDITSLVFQKELSYLRDVVHEMKMEVFNRKTAGG